MNSELQKDEEVLRLHRELAAEKLRADQGWAQYESANADRNALRAEKASAVQPVAAQQHAQATHRPGCDALGGYGNGIGPCSCGIQHAQAAMAELMPKRAAFIAWIESRSIDASIEKDAWGAQIFKHPHVQSMWEGWFNAPTESSCSKQHAQAAQSEINNAL